MKSGEKGKKPARKRPSVADKIRDGEQQAAANKRHEAANFNLYGLDTETDEQSLRAMGGKLPSPPPEFRSSVPPPQSVSSSTSLATTVVPANRIGANGLNMTHDKIKNWNSLQPISSHIQTCNDDLEQVQSTIEELERRKNQETNTNKDTNQEEESIRANRVQPFSSCPNLVQEPRSSPPAPPPGRRPPPPPLGEDENEELPTRAQTTFKLDHLANINPRRLYPNTKFRARIHDVIDERGRFHLEVMYTRDDERKFAQIFKLFRLACKISPPPTDPSDLREGMRVGVFYKDDWHRAVVVEAADSNHRASSHPRVKFLDLGIERRVDAQTNMRVVDEKFFNVPRKALRCSLYVDENVNEVVLASGHGIFRNEPLKLSSDARKFFVRVIYKKVLFAKVIEFTQDPQSNEPICKIRLGCQTHRGIIDVYLYLLSKFDRKRYELIKYIMPSPHQSTAINRLGNNPVTPSSSTSTAATTTTAQSDSDSTAPTYTLPSPPHSIVHESFEAHVGGGAGGEAINSINSGGLQQQVDDEYDPDVLFSDLVGYFDRMKQAANGVLNQVDEGNQYDRNNNNHEESEDCQSYEDDYEEDRRECRGGLDMTPVKEQRRRQDQNDEDDYDSDRTAEAAYNYDGSLYIESIHLPSITEPQQQLECAAQEEPAANISIRSAQQQPSHHHRYMRSHEVYKMSIPMPPSNPLSPPRLPRQRTHLPNTNYNSDTDSSLMHATCCQMPFKAKKTKNTSTKASPRTENHQRLFEEINNLANHGALNANNGKKVKFLS